MMELGEFAAHLLTIEDDLDDAAERACVRACKLVARKARGQLGVPQPYWPPLKAETIARKRRGDTPLLETGELKRSISYDAPHRDGDEVYGYVGATSPHAKYHELGTARVPPRPFLASAAMGAENEIVDIAAAELLKAFLGGSNFDVAMMGIRALKKIWDDIGELAPDDDDDER